MIEVIFRLQHLPGRQAALARYLQRPRQLHCIEVRGPHRANFPRLLQAVESLQRFRYRGLRIRPVGKVEVDIVGIEAAQGVVYRLLDPGFAESLMAGKAEIGADFGENFDLIAHAGTRLQPAANNGFGFAALVALCPAGINIRRIDSVKAVVNKSIKKGKTGFFINGPAKDVTAKH